MRTVNLIGLCVVLCALCSTTVAESDSKPNPKDTTDPTDVASHAVETVGTEHSAELNDLELHLQGVATALLKTLAGASSVVLDGVIEEVSLDTSMATADEDFARHIEKYDANNDGALSIDEWAKVNVDDLPRSFQELSEDERAERIATNIKFVDSNKDGKTTHAEMIQALERIEKISEFAETLKTYSGVDEDNDLLLDLDSLLKPHPDTQDTLNLDFEDRNENGT